MNVAALRKRAQTRFRTLWTQRADVARPDGPPTFNGDGTYTSATTTVATRMACVLQNAGVAAAMNRDVAGDPATLTRLELRYDPQYHLQVDDRVTFTVHDDAGLVGDTFYVVGVGAAYEHVYGVAYVQRTEPDSGG